MSWIQVDAFKRRLKEYTEATGETQAKAAKDLGTTYATLRFWLSGSRSPKRESLQRAAALFKCSVTEFMDDPGGNAASGIPVTVSEKRRFIILQITESISSNEFSDEDVQLLY